jgi:hypothetical protein
LALAARSATFSRFAPFMVVSASGPMGRQHTVMGFYRRGPIFVARAELRQRSTDPNIAFDPPRIVWTTSTACPALSPLLTRLNVMPPPNVRIIPPDSDGQPSFMNDGISFTLWTNEAAWPTDGLPFGSPAYALEMSSNLGTPLAGWVQSARGELEACWTASEPR